MLANFAKIIIKNKWLIILVSVVMIILFGFLSSRLPTNFSFIQFFPKGDKDAEIYHEFIKEYDIKENQALVALTSENILTRAALNKIIDLTKAAEKVKGVERVISLANMDVIRGREDELLVEEAVGNTLPPDESGFNKLIKLLTEDHIIKDSVLSDDMGSTLLIVEIEEDYNLSDKRKTVLDGLREVITKNNNGFFKVKIGGLPAMRQDYIDIIEEETAALFLFGFLVLILLLSLTFRNWQGVALPLLVVVFTVFATMGLMHLYGGSLNIMTHILPILILIVGVSNSIHFITRYYDEISSRNKFDSLHSTIVHLTVACFMTSTTTAVGFAVLLNTNIKLIQEYGLFAAIGVMFSYITTITLLPSLLLVTPLPVVLKRKKIKTPLTGPILEKIARLVTSRPVIVIIAFAAVAFIAVILASGVQRDCKILEDLDESNPIVKTNTFLEQKLGGVIPLEILVTLDKTDAFLEPENLKKLENLQTEILQYDEIGKAVSFLDYLKAMNKGIHSGKNEFYRIPESRAYASQLLLALSGGDRILNDFVTADYRKVRISARLYDVGEKRGREIYKAIEEKFHSLWGGNAKIVLTGTSPVAHKINSYIVDNIFWSFLLAFGVITLLIVFLLRSVALALISLIPNIIPLLTTLAVMGAVDLPLKPSTAIIFSIAFGIAVDDTIHFLVRYVSEHNSTGDPVQAVRRTLQGTGRAMVYTSVVLIAGMAVALFSRIKADQNFASLCILTIATALIADLLLLPALLLVIKPKIPKIPGVKSGD